MMNRRTFVGTTAATLAAAKLGWAMPADHKIKAVGVQLYTVRDAMKSDFDGTIAKVAQVGYKEVEFAGYFDKSPKDISDILKKNGLASPSCHVVYVVVEKNLSEQIEASHIIGHKFIVCPWIDPKQRTEPDGFKRAADLFQKAGEQTLKAGIQFAYHNHTFEFQPSDALAGKLPYDVLLATDPKYVKMELDLCWISVAGKDPVAYFEKYPGHFPLVHVKDWIKDASTPSAYQGAMGQSVKFGGRMADVGQGSVDWKRIFAHSEQAGIKHYFVENDDPQSVFDDIKISYDYLHSLQF
jgi:sugar phosphate isomerase/epimerase